MNSTHKRIALGTCLIVMTGASVDTGSPLGIEFIPRAEAIIGVAPGGSVARRHAIVATETVVAASTANATAAAAANANAQAAAAKPPPPPAPAAAPSGPPPVGTIVTALPPGCTPTVLNNVEYQRCGATYYKASMMGSNLVFVVAQP